MIFLNKIYSEGTLKRINHETHEMETTTNFTFTNTTDDNVTTSAYDRNVSAFYFVLVLAVCLFGLVGNVLTIIVLLKKQEWTSVTFLIGVMSVSDFLSLCVIISIPFQAHFLEQFQDVTHYFQDPPGLSSCLCAAIIGSERAFAVTRPMQFKETWNTKLSVRMFLTTFTFSMMFVIARYVLSERYGFIYFKAYFYLSYYIIVRGIPFVIILVANILMIRGLIQSGKRLKTMATDDCRKIRIKAEANITKTVVVLTSVYFLCMIPGRILVGIMYAGVFEDKTDAIFYVQTVLEIFNFSVNIVIYTVTSKYFRGEYYALLCCCLQKYRTAQPSVPNVSTSVELH